MNRPRQRLDLLLVARGLCESREKAQRVIMAGAVMVGSTVVDKASAKVPEDAEIVVKTAERYVGRGGLKLEAALREFSVDPTGAVGLDIGASTGGFTDCLLKHGAVKVYAVDVGHSQLAWKIRSDARVVVLEHCNARRLGPAEIPEPIDVCVIDVSFISLTLILPPALQLLRSTGVLIALIKPQFELRKEDVARGGVVRDPALHEQAVAKVRDFVGASLHCEWQGCIPSPILGGEGNKEFLACLRPKASGGGAE